MDTYKIRLKVDEDIVFEHNQIRENEIYDCLIKYINYNTLFPRAIVESCKKEGGSACWCGTENVGYTIAKNTKDCSFLDYYFQ